LFNERVATSTVKVIRSELDVLNTSVKAFGRFGGDNLPNVRDLRPIGARSYNIYILSEASESTEGIRIQGRGASEPWLTPESIGVCFSK